MGSNKNRSSQSFGLLRKCFNKYFLTGLCFVVWVLFFDKHNLFTQQKIKHSVEKLQEEKKSYEILLKDAIQERKDLKLNEEKLAREKYLMHKKGEEIFIIEKKAKSL